MLRSIQRGWVGWAIVVAVASTVGCGKEHEGAEQSTGVQRAGKGSRSHAPEGPPKRIFAKRFVANVRSGPSRDASRVGYLRGGAVLRATTAEPVGHDGCRGGWFELTTGGYVCNGRDVIAFDGKRLPEVRSTQPDLSAKMPYQYGLIRKDHTPIYRRLPTEEEAAEYEGYVPPGQRKQQAKAKPAASAGAGDAGTGAVATAVAEEGAKPGASTGVAPDSASGEQDGGVADAGPPTLDSLQPSEEESGVLQRWVMRGFYVSLDKTFDVGRRRYWRTQQNGFVPYNSVMLVDGSDFHGAVLDGEKWALPIGFILSRHTPRYVAPEGGRIRLDRKKPGYHYMFRIVGEREQRGREYYEGQDGFLYRADQVVRIDARQRPANVRDTKWVDVDLSKQTLVAYDGDRPVFATLISSGRVRNENVDQLNHATPTGTFRFTSKHLTHSMDGDNAIDGPYSIDDVPYVMYFQLAFATHSAFWHNRFGRPKSHGCINMSPLDAKWLFNWADPPLPEGWHGIYPTKNGRHTTIIIRGETPEG